MRTYRLKQMTLVVGLLCLITAPAAETQASSVVDLGGAKDFAILGGQTVTALNEEDRVRFSHYALERLEAVEAAQPDAA